MVKSFKVTEEYGVCGPCNALEITTTTLSSCSAIIMFSKTSKVLGLYHYPGSTLAAAGVQAAITQMINDIKPTAMVLWTANPQSVMGNVDQEKKIIQLDNAKVKTFLELKKPSACTLEVVTGETFPGVSSDGTTLDFNGNIMADIKVPGSATITKGSGETRKQSGNIWYYFGSSDGAGAYADKLIKAALRIREIELG